jgi:hypothetical protein
MAFGYGPFDASPVWTDVSTYVQDVSTRTGRGSEFDYFSAGECTLRLVDVERRFDPLHAAGPYFGLLRPNVPVRVRASLPSAGVALLDEGGAALLDEGGAALTDETTSTAYSDVWYGFVDGWSQGYTDANSVTYVTVTATDATKILSRKRLKSVYETEVLADSPHLYWRLGETGPVATDSSGNSIDGAYGNVALQRSSETIVPFGAPSLRIVAAEPTSVTAPATARILSEPQSIEFWVQSDGELDPGVTSTQYVVFWQGDADTADDRVIVYYQRSVSSNDEEIWCYGGGNRTNWVAKLDDSKTHHVVVVLSGGAKTLYVDGQAVAAAATAVDSLGTGLSDVLWLGLASDPSSFDAQWIGWLSDVAYYDTALSSTRVEAHYAGGVAPWDLDTTGERVGRVLDEAAWPAAARDVDSGLVLLGAADIAGRTAWDYLQSVAQTEGGRLFFGPDGHLTFHQYDRFLTASTETTSQWTFTDDGGSDGTYRAGRLRFDLDDRFIYNEASVTRDGGLVQTASDATSVDDYGPSTLTLSGLLFRDDSQSRGLAERVVYRHKTPVDRADMWLVSPESQPDSWESLLGLRIGHRVTLELTPLGTGSQIAKAMHIEQIVHRITPGSWDIEFRGSPVDPNAGTYFIFDGVGATQGFDQGAFL